MTDQVKKVEVKADRKDAVTLQHEAEAKSDAEHKKIADAKEAQYDKDNPPVTLETADFHKMSLIDAFELIRGHIVGKTAAKEAKEVTKKPASGSPILHPDGSPVRDSDGNIVRNA